MNCIVLYWHCWTCIQFHSHWTTFKINLEWHGLLGFTGRDMIQVPNFPITFFGISTLQDIYSRFRHLWGRLSFPACSLCIPNYATMKTAFLQGGTPLWAMWSRTAVTRFKFLSVLAQGTLSLSGGLDEACSFPVFIVSSLLIGVPGPCSPWSTWTY